ncbi:MAG TPA: peptidoglycan recognition family protein, partial [Myxococcota bacterium]|nr:peptidoglycan recognition family protein [Myxococcota bacterium]
DTWGPWEPIEAYWQEGVAHNGHLDAPDGLGLGFQLRLSNGEAPQHVVAEGIEVLGEPGAEELPQELAAPPAGDGQYGELEQALFPSTIVHPRSDWGARAPRCSLSSHSPVKVTVHHTATPLPDSMTVRQRLRQIQSYHMYTNGWCDIGYHVLVDWNGAAWQGRNETKVGAHVLDHNTGNVGVSYLGTYTTHSVSSTQVNKGAAILRWLHNRYGIPRSRTYIKGHRQYAATACPGDKLYAKLNTMVELSKQ